MRSIAVKRVAVKCKGQRPSKEPDRLDLPRFAQAQQRQFLWHLADSTMQFDFGQGMLKPHMPTAAPMNIGPSTGGGLTQHAMSYL